MRRDRGRRVHFVGIGGVGMSGIAEVLLSRGYAVSGSDLARSPATERLEALGARCHEGHAAAHAVGADVVVVSSAIAPDNPEVLEARRLGIPVLPRAEMLAELMRAQRGIAVSGSHGKTTTTSLIAAVLEAGGLDPTVVVGGRLGRLSSGARLGRGPWLVAEADESDRSFLRLSPAIAVITNVDREHMDAYADTEDQLAAFAAFASRVPFDGAAVLCADDAAVRGLLPRVERRVVGYGLSPGSHVSARDVRLEPEGSRFTVLLRGEVLGSVALPVPGAHNVLNALAAVAVGLELGVPFGAVREGLAGFAGVERRFQRRGHARGVSVIDDYGHHPAEIRVTLETLHAWAGPRRTLVLFQPHRYSRTRALWEDFASAFPRAGRVLLCDVYAAGEPPLEGVTSERLAPELAARSGVPAEYAGSRREAVGRLLAEVRPGDVVLTLGAGDVWKSGVELLEKLEGQA